jgi:hypothetical protein
MKHLNKAILWGVIVVFLALSFGTFALRWRNEQTNTTIIAAADYREFTRAAMYANRDVNGLLLELRDAGVTTLGLREVSMRDMAVQGRILAVPFGEFLAETRIRGGDLLPIVEAILEEAGYIGDINIVAISPCADTSAFMLERLSVRYNHPEFFHFRFGGGDYFIMNVELMRFEEWLDALLGFDEAEMAHLTGLGFSLMLLPGASRGTNDAHWDELEYLIPKYNVRLITFGNQIFNGTPEHIEKAHTLIERHNMIMGIVEAPHQVGFVDQAGLVPLMQRLDYQVNRVYSTMNDDFVNAPRDRYHRWVRSVVDRGIRIMYFRPFRDLRSDVSVALDAAIAQISDFTATMEGKGYTFAGSLEPLDTSMPTRGNRLALGLSLSVAGVLYLAYLFRLKDSTTLIALAAVSALCVAANLALDWTKLYALAAAVLYPAFSSLLMLIYIKTYKHHFIIKKLAFALGILIAVNALGMYTIAASLADIRYLMHIEFFTGVKVSLFAPLGLFALNYIMVFKDEDNLFDVVYKLLLKTPNYLILFAGGLGLVLAYVSLTRSGNMPTIGPSQIELRLREFLEHFFLARPRFREILIGYPAFAVMVYLYHRYKASFLLLVPGFGVMLGSASMINSFAHTFTAINISMHRTWAGFLTGSAVAVAALAGVIAVERLFLLWYRKYR